MTTFTRPDADGPSIQDDLFVYVEGLLGLSHSHRIPLQNKYKQGEAPNLWIIQSFSREYPEGNLKVHMDVTTDDYFKDWALSETRYYYTKQHRVTSGSSHGYGGLPNIDDTNIAVLNSELGDWIKNGSETAERLVVGTSKNLLVRLGVFPSEDFEPVQPCRDDGPDGLAIANYRIAISSKASFGLDGDWWIVQRKLNPHWELTTLRGHHDYKLFDYDPHTDDDQLTIRTYQIPQELKQKLYFRVRYVLGTPFVGIDGETPRTTSGTTKTLARVLWTDAWKKSRGKAWLVNSEEMTAEGDAAKKTAQSFGRAPRDGDEDEAKRAVYVFHDFWGGPRKENGQWTRFQRGRAPSSQS